MDNIPNTEFKFNDSYEIKVFDGICAELLILDNLLKTNLNVSGLEDSNASFKEKMFAIWSTLVEIISNKKTEAERTLSPLDQKLFNEVLYVAVSLIDENFLRKEKIISDYWRKNLLEIYFFRTRETGRKFYEKINTILQNQNEKNKIMAYIYFQTLSMGFKGKYYCNEYEKESDINNYKKSLYGYIFNINLYSAENNLKSHLSNGVVSVDEVKGSILADNKKVYLYIIFIIVFYILSSYAFWYYKSYNLNYILRAVVDPLESIVK